MSEPTKEYLEAKAKLCKDVAFKQVEEGDIKNAIKNLERANLAMYRLFGIQEEEGKNE
jgi:hypothetical protein